MPAPSKKVLETASLLGLRTGERHSNMSYVGGDAGGPDLFLRFDATGLSAASVVRTFARHLVEKATEAGYAHARDSVRNLLGAASTTDAEETGRDLRERIDAVERQANTATRD